MEVMAAISGKEMKYCGSQDQSGMGPSGFDVFSIRIVNNGVVVAHTKRPARCAGDKCMRMF